MDQDDDWDVISVETIARDFQIPFLAQMIENHKHVSVNMDHISGWVEPEQSGESERFMYLPIVEFKPMGNDEGFQLIHHHHDLNSDGEAVATALTFHKPDSGDGYKVYLDEDCHIVEEVLTFPNDECAFDDLEEFPPKGTQGYDGPFQTLDFDPTAE